MNIRYHYIYLAVIAVVSAFALWLYRASSENSAAKTELERQTVALRLQTLADEAFIAGSADTAFTLYERLASESDNPSQTRDIIERRQIAENLRLQDFLRKDSLLLLQADRKMLLAALQRRQRAVYALSRSARQEASARQQERERFERNIAELEARLNETNRALEERRPAFQTLRFKSAKDQESVIYVGDVVDEQANGYGVGVWASSGSVYEGSWRNNKRHGLGVHQWKDGVRYEGDFVDDFRTGKGTYYWKNGDKYVGDWKDGKRQGRGSVYDKNGVLKASGDWENDRLVKKDAL